MNSKASENLKTRPALVNAERVEFMSQHDGQRDWYLVVPGRPDRPCYVNIHGHGSAGDQLWVRADIRPNLEAAVSEGLTVISPNLRGNAWMSPAAAEDMVQIINTERPKHPWTKTFFVAGSMGGTSSLVFAALRPEHVDGVVALGAATDIARYEAWCRSPDSPAATITIRNQIANAIAHAYGDADKTAHSASGNAEKLTMPIVLIHGEKDTLIPVEEARHLATKLKHKHNFTYREIPGGNHDSPLDLWNEAITLLKGMLQK